MALQISIQYHGHNVTYEVTVEEEGVYKLCRKSETANSHGEYIPEKIMIRKKGKIWVSDLEDRQELVNALTGELSQFNATNYNAA